MKVILCLIYSAFHFCEVCACCEAVCNSILCTVSRVYPPFIMMHKLHMHVTWCDWLFLLSPAGEGFWHAGVG